MTIIERPNRDKTKILFYYSYGRKEGQRTSTGIFKYAKPKTLIEKNHNKEAQNLLDTLKSQTILEQQAIGTGYIPKHKFKENFLDFYEEFVKHNKRFANRHLEGSLKHFKNFVKYDHLPPIDITGNLCSRFRQYLLDNFRRDTPANYVARFKKVLKAATKQGYFKMNPVEDVKAKSGKKTKPKQNLEIAGYLQLLRTPCYNREIREAFILCCYTAMRWCDVKILSWNDIEGDQLKTQIIQEKTGETLYITLHPIALTILAKRKERLQRDNSNHFVFKIPGNNHCNEILEKWCQDAGIKKHITWHCARLSFSILLQDALVDTATVALLLGQTTTKYVNEVYKRHRPKDQTESINRLPGIGTDLQFVQL